jgi:SAM-dependent methyltransferase
MAKDTTTNIALAEEQQARLNAARWAEGEFVELYASQRLRAVEAVLLDRYQAELSGRVLELGCGAGRLSGHLIELAREFHGLDLAPSMVDYCRQAYPRGTFSVRDLRDLSAFDEASYDVVVAPFNVLDVLGDDARRKALGNLHRLLVADGLLIMSSHNLAYAARAAAKLRLWMRLAVGAPRRPLRSLRSLPERLRNRLRLRRLQHVENDYAVLNDEAHDFSVLHYYISRDAQEAQMAGHGFRLLECLDLDGHLVSVGETAGHSPELHYVARG